MGRQRMLWSLQCTLQGAEESKGRHLECCFILQDRSVLMFTA